MQGITTEESTVTKTDSFKEKQRVIALGGYRCRSDGRVDAIYWYYREWVLWKNSTIWLKTQFKKITFYTLDFLIYL